jgi:hypothetical protein
MLECPASSSADAAVVEAMMRIMNLPMREASLIFMLHFPEVMVLSDSSPKIIGPVRRPDGSAEGGRLCACTRRMR